MGSCCSSTQKVQPSNVQKKEQSKDESQVDKQKNNQGEKNKKFHQVDKSDISDRISEKNTEIISAQKNNNQKASIQNSSVDSSQELIRRNVTVQKVEIGEFYNSLEKTSNNITAQDIVVLQNLVFSFRVYPPCLLTFDIKSYTFKEIVVQGVERFPRHARMIVLNQLKKLLIIGGTFDQPPNHQPLNIVYEYDLQKRKLSELPNMLCYHMGSCCYAQNSKYVYVIGGISKDLNFSNEAERYDLDLKK